MAYISEWIVPGDNCCFCVTCCMYPSNDDGTLPYPDTDLPGSIIVIINGVEKTLPLFIGGSFAFYRKIDGAITTEVSCNIFSPFIWQLSQSSIYSYSECLMGFSDDDSGGGATIYVKDEFLDVYHFTFDAGNGPIEYTLTRQNLCYWQVSAAGHNASPGGYEGLYYESFIPYAKETATPPYNLCWVLTFVDDNGDLQGEFVKDDPQSSPEGDYGAFITVIP